jgi:murein L,D-transpeptidase YcbB/YkuD
MIGFRPYRIAAFLLVSLTLAGCQKKPNEVSPGTSPAASPATSPAVSQTIQATVESKTVPAAVRGQKEREQAWKEMRSFYEKRQFQPAWLTPKGPLPQAKELIAAVDPMASEGLDPQRYPKDALSTELQQVAKQPEPEDPQGQRRLAQTDMRLTYTYLTMAAHLASGRLQPESLNVDWYTKPRHVELESHLEQALQQGGSVTQTLHSYAPPGKDYARLRDALARYRGLAAHGGWPAVGTQLKKGDRGEKVRLLRARLAMEGDLRTPAAPAAAGAGAAAPEDIVYDATVEDGVARFQHRHGFKPTGKLDADTLAELDVPVQERIRQIQVNLERWRWLPADFGQRYIEVNIPEFRMKLVEDGKTTLEMRVVVGKAQQSRTPVFSDKMTYLELNPAWNIPKDIVKKEIEPAAAKHPGYLARKNIEVVNGTEYRQRPGPDNPLGRVKFMFPNQFDVYLHDTPADHLFAKSERDFSHGCIRLENPVDLADALLKDDPKWTPEAIQEAIDSGEQKTVSIPHPLPVHILYFTAWVDDDGTIEFRRDVYGHDAKLTAALDQEPPVTLGFDGSQGQVAAALPPARPTKSREDS